MTNKMFIDRITQIISIERLSTEGYLVNTDQFDEILKNKENYGFKFTKIYNQHYYEAILDTNNYKVDRLMRSLLDNSQLDKDVDSEDIEDIEDIEDVTQKNNEYIVRDTNHIYEISPISDEMLVFICDYILESENRYYAYNLRRFMHIGRRSHKEGDNRELKISDLILQQFKRRFLTLKIKTDKKTDYSQFKELKNSYLFNFMLLNNIELTTENRKNNILFREFNHFRKKDMQPFEGVIPKTVYDSNLIIRYKKAMTANDFFSKYLSYYHIIEYYFDRLYNDDVVKQMKNWMKDVQMTLEDDESILKFADKVKKIKGKSSEDGQGNEQDAFVLVLEEYVDIDKLKHKLSRIKKEEVEAEYQFTIQENNLLDFYTNNSVDFIGENLKIDFNNENTANKNIRTRIYRTRNSLVHSKDNYKFKTYHPYDDEKYLVKEIPLIKLLAEEIIINSSNPIYD